MTEKPAGTSGGRCGTSGVRRNRIALLVLGFVAFTGLQVYVNVATSLADFASAGQPQTLLHVMIWQITSVVIWIALLPAIGFVPLQPCLTKRPGDAPGNVTGGFAQPCG